MSPLRRFFAALVSASILLSPLSAFAVATTTFVKLPPPPANLVQFVESTRSTLVSCDPYAPQIAPVSISLAPSVPSATPGSSIVLTGTVTNSGRAGNGPVVDARVSARIVAVSNSSRTLVETVAVAGPLSLAPGASVPVSFTYVVPADAPGGNYDVLASAIGSDRFPLSDPSIMKDTRGAVTARFSVTSSKTASPSDIQPSSISSTTPATATPQIAFVTSSAYPIEKGHTVALCFLMTQKGSPLTYTVTVSATRAGGIWNILRPFGLGTIASARYDGHIGPVPVALVAPATGGASSFDMTATISRDGKVFDSVTVPYRCTELGAECASSGTSFVVEVVVALLIALGIAGVGVFYMHKRLHPTAPNNQPL